MDKKKSLFFNIYVYCHEWFGTKTAKLLKVGLIMCCQVINFVLKIWKITSYKNCRVKSTLLNKYENTPVKYKKLIIVFKYST